MRVANTKLILKDECKDLQFEAYKAEIYQLDEKGNVVETDIALDEKQQITPDEERSLINDFIDRTFAQKVFGICV